MAEIIDRITRVAEQALGSIKVSSALNPCLWLCVVATPLGLYGAVNSTPPVQTVCLAIASIPLLTFAVGFLYFMVLNPDKLRSEQYELKKMALELIEEKGGRIPMSSSSVEAIANTEFVNREEDEKRGVD